jgi:hypothetical protein
MAQERKQVGRRAWPRGGRAEDRHPWPRGGRRPAAQVWPRSGGGVSLAAVSYVRTREIRLT